MRQGLNVPAAIGMQAAAQTSSETISMRSMVLVLLGMGRPARLVTARCRTGLPRRPYGLPGVHDA